jgi:hypothetical protein
MAKLEAQNAAIKVKETALATVLQEEEAKVPKSAQIVAQTKVAGRQAELVIKASRVETALRKSRENLAKAQMRVSVGTLATDVSTEHMGSEREQKVEQSKPVAGGKAGCWLEETCCPSKGRSCVSPTPIRYRARAAEQSDKAGIMEEACLRQAKVQYEDCKIVAYNPINATFGPSGNMISYELTNRGLPVLQKLNRRGLDLQGADETPEDWSAADGDAMDHGTALPVGWTIAKDKDSHHLASEFNRYLANPQPGSRRRVYKLSDGNRWKRSGGEVMGIPSERRLGDAASDGEVQRVIRRTAPVVGHEPISKVKMYGVQLSQSRGREKKTIMKNDYLERSADQDPVAQALELMRRMQKGVALAGGDAHFSSDSKGWHEAKPSEDIEGDIESGRDTERK